MRKFTQGVWNINKHSSTTVESNGRSIATMGGYSDNSNIEQVDIENLANTKLIAVAPEMLECLEGIKKTIESSEHWWMDCPNKGGFDLEKIDELIKKATE